MNVASRGKHRRVTGDDSAPSGVQDGQRRQRDIDVLRAAYAGFITKDESRKMRRARPPRRQRQRPRVVESKLPKTDELTERDFDRLERAAERQLERNRRRIERG